MPDMRVTRVASGCYVYVDGWYVRSELRKGDKSDEFDPREPAKILRQQEIIDGIVMPALIPSRYFYYDALDLMADDEEQERQKRYFERLARLPYTHVVLGEVRKTKKAREQKGVDVQLAVDALKAATQGVVSTVALVAGDADFAPLVNAIREVGPHVHVMAFQSSLSKSLAREADRVHIIESIPHDWGLAASE